MNEDITPLSAKLVSVGYEPSDTITIASPGPVNMREIGMINILEYAPPANAVPTTAQELGRAARGIVAAVIWFTIVTGLVWGGIEAAQFWMGLFG